MAEANAKSITKAQAGLLMSDLQPYGHQAVLESLKRCRLELRYFPTVSEIVARIPGTLSDESRAQAGVAQVLEAISRFGPYRHDEAKEFIGPLGWEVVKEYGGWQSLCASLGVDTPIGVFKAQALKSALSILERARAGVLRQAPELPAPRSGYTVGVDMAVGPSKLIVHVPSKEDKS